MSVEIIRNSASKYSYPGGVNKKGNTRLYKIVKYHSSKTIEEFLKTCPPGWLNHQNKEGKSPVFYTRNTRSFTILRKAGARIDLSDAEGCTLLHNIVNEGIASDRLIKAIVRRTPLSLLNYEHSEFGTPICLSKTYTVFKILREAGAEWKVNNFWKLIYRSTVKDYFEPNDSFTKIVEHIFFTEHNIPRKELWDNLEFCLERLDGYYKSKNALNFFKRILVEKDFFLWLTDNQEKLKYLFLRKKFYGFGEFFLGLYRQGLIPKEDFFYEIISVFALRQGDWEIYDEMVTLGYGIKGISEVCIGMPLYYSAAKGVSIFTRMAIPNNAAEAYTCFKTLIKIIFSNLPYKMTLYEKRSCGYKLAKDYPMRRKWKILFYEIFRTRPDLLNAIFRKIKNPVYFSFFGDKYVEIGPWWERKKLYIDLPIVLDFIDKCHVDYPIDRFREDAKLLLHCPVTVWKNQKIILNYIERGIISEDYCREICLHFITYPGRYNKTTQTPVNYIVDYKKLLRKIFLKKELQSSLIDRVDETFSYVNFRQNLIADFVQYFLKMNTGWYLGKIISSLKRKDYVLFIKSLFFNDKKFSLKDCPNNALEAYRLNFYLYPELKELFFKPIFPDINIYRKKYSYIYAYFLPILASLTIEERKNIPESIEEQILFFIKYIYREKNFLAYEFPPEPLMRGKSIYIRFQYEKGFIQTAHELIEKISAGFIQSKIEEYNGLYKEFFPESTIAFDAASPLALPVLQYTDLVRKEHFALIPDHPHLSVFAGLLTEPEVNLRDFITLFWRKFSNHPELNVLPLIRFFFYRPEIGALFAQNVFTLSSIDVGTGGWCRYNYAHLIEYMFPQKKEMKKYKITHNAGDPEFTKKIQIAYTQTFSAIPTIESILELNKESEKIHTRYGRVITLNKPGKKRITGYKFQRVDEAKEAFIREFFMTQCFAEHPDYRSTLPKPIGVFILKKTPDWILENTIKIIAEGALVYQFETISDYYEYLGTSTLSLEKTEQGRNRFAYDSGLEIREQYFADPAPLFHNSDRKYQILTNLTLLAEASRLKMPKPGAGRIDKVFKSVEFPNGGALGRRDIGDGMLKEMLLKDPSLETSYFTKDSSFICIPPEYYFEMNALAKVILVDTILLLKRYKEMNLIDWKNHERVWEFASYLKECQVNLLQGYLKKDRKICADFIESGAIDWMSAARQLLFWSQTDEEGYPGYLKEGILPDGLYPPETITSAIFAKHSKNFDPEKGFITDGEADLGAFNGPLACPEFELSIYWTTFTAVCVALDLEEI